MEESPVVSVIVVSFNTKRLTVDCIESLYKHTKAPFETIVVDNASHDDTVAALRRLKKPKLKIIQNKRNFGFAKANNQGIKVAKGKYILCLNSDTILFEDSISEVVNYLENNKKVGVAGCKLLNEDNSLQASGGFFPTLLRLFLWMSLIDDIPVVNRMVKPFHPPINWFNKTHSQDWITGAFFMIRRETLNKIGVFDEDYFMYVEELDLCFRAKNMGWSVQYLSSTGIIHLGRASSTNEFAIVSEYKNILLFYKKHFNKFTFVAKMLLRFGALIRILLLALLGKNVQQKIYTKAIAAV